MITFLLVLALIVAVAAVIFVLQNAAVVPVVTLYLWHFENKPLALILLLALAVGMLIGILTILPGSIRNRWRITGLRKQADGLRKSLLGVQEKLDQANQMIAELQRKPISAESGASPASTPAAPAEALPSETTESAEEPPEDDEPA